MKRIILIIYALTFVLSGFSKKMSDDELISRSMADAGKERVFVIDGRNIKDLDIDGYSNPAEYNIRRGAPNFLRKCAAGEDVTVSFIGGSITNGVYQHRNQVANYISSLYPNVKMRGINAGIGGSGAELGAARLSRELLIYDPDLLFIEYAVNGSDADGVEGIIRQAIKHNPEIDICLTYTLYRGQSKQYGAGEVPANIQKLDKVAERYNLPSVHMGMWAGELERDGELIWANRKDVEGKIVFSRDGVHPATAGGNLYGAAVGRAFRAMDALPKSKSPVILELGDRLMVNAYDEACYISPIELTSGLRGWESEKYVASPDLDPKYSDWFVDVSTADKDSEPIRFKFDGNLIGMWDISGPDGCGVDIYLNGKKLIATNTKINSKVIKWEFAEGDDTRISSYRFNPLCDEIHPHYVTFKLPRDVYDVEIRVNGQKLDKAKLLKLDNDAAPLGSEYDPQRLHLCWIILNGQLLH